MAQLKELTADEILALFNSPQTISIFMKNKKKMHNDRYDAIGIKNQKNAKAFLKKFFQKQPNAANDYTTAPITFAHVAQLLDFVEKCKIQQL